MRSLYIDHLVLDGFAGSDRDALVRALQRELTVLLGERGGELEGGTARSIPAVEAALAPGDTPDAAGAAIARALHDALGGGGR